MENRLSTSKQTNKKVRKEWNWFKEQLKMIELHTVYDFKEKAESEL